MAFYGSPASQAADAPPERIKALALGLEKNPDRIYEFVRQSIVYEPQFGLHKGGEGALLDGAGGAFDQSQLMVQLLTAAGWGSRYVYGTVTLGSEAASILRVGDARQACLLLASAGTPATINGQTSCASLSGAVQSVQMLHVWVEAYINDGWYAFDPSLKRSDRVTGIDVWSATGTTASAAWNTVSSGVSSGQASVTGVDQAAVSGKMAAYATTLQADLIANHADKGLVDIVGGWSIAPGPGNGMVPVTQRNGSLPGGQVITRWEGDVPAPFRATLRLQTAGFIKTYDLPSLYAYRVQGQIQQRVFKVAVRKCDHLNGDPTAYFGGQPFPSPTTPCEADNTATGGDDVNAFEGWNRRLEILIDHPYAADNGTFADAVTLKSIEIGKRVDILVRMAGSIGTRSTLWSSAIDPLMDLKVVREGSPYECKIYNGPGPNIPPKVGDVCDTKTGAEDWNYYIQNNDKFAKGEVVSAEMKYRKDSVLNLWSEMFDTSSRIVEGLSGARILHQHSIGVALNPSYGATVIDVDTAVGVATTGTDQPHQIASALAAAASAMETAAVSQITAESFGSGTHGTSGIRRVAGGGNLFRLDPGQGSASLPSSITAPVRAEIDRYLAANHSVVVPESSDGFFARRVDGAEYAWIIGQGTVGTPSPDDVDPRSPFRKGGTSEGPRPLDFLGKAEEQSIAANVAGTQLGSVDLRTGSLAFGEGEEVSSGQGEFPYSLGFTRRYASSGTAGTFGELGAGWTHNWESSASRKMDASAYLSENDAVSAVPIILSLSLAIEAGRRNTIEASLLSGTVLNWWVSEATGYENAALVNGGGRSARFIRLVNGQWRNPSAPAERLTLGANNSAQHLWYDWMLSDGSVQQFRPLSLAPGMPHYGSQSVADKGRVALKHWVFPQGVRIDLNYSAQTPTNMPYLVGVSNTVGASLSFQFTTNPTEEQTTQCLQLAGAIEDAGTSKKECQLAAQRGGRLIGVSNGVTAVGLGHLEDCYINTTYCAYYLTVALQGGKRTRYYQYDMPPNAWGIGLFGYQRLLVNVVDEGLAMPRARYVWRGQAGQVSPRVVESFDVQNRKTTYHATQGLLSSATDPAGGTVRQAYDPEGRLTVSRDAMGRASRQTFYGTGRTASIQSAWGDVTAFTYDARGNLIEKRQTPTCQNDIWWCQTIVTRAAYHPTWNKPTKIILPATIDGQPETEWTLEYDGRGLLVRQVSPSVYNARTGAYAEAVTTTWYDAQGRVERTRDPMGLETVQVWGGGGQAGFCLRQTIGSAQGGGLNLVTAMSCDAVGNVTSVTDPRGQVTTTWYDALRRKVYETGPAGTNLQSLWRYDLDGNPTEAWRYEAEAEAWRGTVTTFSATGQPLTVTDPAGDVSRTCYDLLDRPVVAVDPTGRATRTTYNGVGQPTAVERWFTADVSDAGCTLADGRPSGIGTHLWRAYEYNGGGLQSAEIDANGNRTTQLYEGLGRAIVTVHADGAETWTIRNQRGQVLIGKTRGGDFQTTYHDALGRVQAIIEGGQVDGRWSRTGYDLSGRTVWKDVSNQPGPSWNESLRRDIHVYHYDAAGRVRADEWLPSDSSAGSATFTTTYGYDAAGNRTSIAWPDGFTATYGFDAANRPANVSFGDNHAAMAYDGLGRRRSLGRSTGVATTWAYEVDGDLASIVHPFWNGGVTLSYGHDAAGRTTSVGTSDGRFEWMPSIGYGRSYGVANGLNQATSMGGTGLSWTPNGNLAGDGTNTYHWTWGNRLAGISRPGTSATYAYDAEDRRSMKIVDGVMTRTLWSGADELAQMSADGTVLRRFVPDGSGAMDGRLATLEANGTVYWHHTDHQGSVIATSNAAGHVVSVVNYSPHGELGTAADGTPLTAPPTGSPFGYTGRTYDPESGLWQYRARYLHPKVGSFLSQDPIGTKDDPNLYMYVGLDPVNNTDPMGMQACGTAPNCIEARRPNANRTDRATVTQNSAGDAAVISQVSRYESSGDVENGARVDNQSPVAVDSSLAGDPSGAGPAVSQIPMRTVVNGNVIRSTMRGVRGATSVAHSHPVGNSDPSPGPDDDVAVNAGFPNNIIHDGNVVVVEKVDGQFRVRITQNNNISRSDRREIQRDVNRFQDRVQ